MFRKLFAVCSATVMCASLQGCINVPIADLFPTPYYREVVVEEGSDRSKILILDVDGVITSGISSPSPLFPVADSTVTSVGERLNKAREDKSIKAVILRVDSPGGGVTASDVTYRMLAKYKEETEIPIYVSMLDLAASGGYYISMASDEIYAHPTSITGSIGVIAMFPQLENLGHKIGVYVEVIESGENKNMTGGFKNMTPEQREIMQTVIMDMYDRFVEVVHKGRPELEESEIRRLADGRIYTAQQAVENGLVDGIMYLDDLIEYVRKKQGLADASVVLYRKTSYEEVDSPYAKAPVTTIDAQQQVNEVNASLVNIEGVFPGQHGPVLNYLWKP